MEPPLESAKTGFGEIKARRIQGQASATEEAQGEACWLYRHVSAPPLDFRQVTNKEK